jgi:hypothetical protein
MYGVGARGFGLLARTIRGRERGSAGAGAGGRRRGDAGGGGRTRGEGVEVGPSGSAPCGFRSDAVAEGNFGFGAGTKRITARD